MSSGYFIKRSEDMTVCGSPDRTDDDMADVLETLKKYPHIMDIDLSWNRFSDADAVKILSHCNKNVHTISFAHNPVGHGLTAFIFKSLYEGTWTGLKNLDLSHTNVGVEGACHLGNALRFNSTLQDINLEHCKIGLKGIDCLIKGFGAKRRGWLLGGIKELYNTTLQTLHLTYGIRISESQKLTLMEIYEFQMNNRGQGHVSVSV